VIRPIFHLGRIVPQEVWALTDTGDKKVVIGGLAREFYHRVWPLQHGPKAWVWQKKEEYVTKARVPRLDGENRTMWIFEPIVGRKRIRRFC